MVTKRIIPCLDVRDGKVTKGVAFKGNMDVGDPVEMQDSIMRMVQMNWCFMILLLVMKSEI